MKLSTKIILPIILISALLILLNGCMGTVPDESPGYTPGTITGIIASPCCSLSSDPADGETASPEYWCYWCQNTWDLQDGIEVVLTYGEDEIATTVTNNKGEFTFSDVSPGKNYVVTAYCPDFADNRPLVKDVALEIIEGGSFDTKITDLVSTSLGLVVDFLVNYTEMGPEDISLIEVIADKPSFPNFPKFKKLVYEVRRVLENCEVNMLTDDDLQDALCFASEEVGRVTFPDLVIGCVAGYTPPPPPPPGACDGNLLPIIDSVESNSLPVIEGSTVNLVLGESYDIVVTAHDQDTKLGTLTYYATVDGVKSPVTTTGQVTVKPILPGTYEVYLYVNDGCIDVRWGPVTVVVCLPLDPALAITISDETPCYGTCATISKITVSYTDGVTPSFDITPSYEGKNLTWVVDVGITFNPVDGTVCLDELNDGQPGVNYNIKFTYTDECSGTATVIGTATVNFNAAPTADAGGPYPVDDVCPEGSAIVNFVGSATGVAPLSYEWNFGDGGTASGTLTPSHEYSAGTYSATLTVTDGCDNIVTSAAVEISFAELAAPTADAGGPYPVDDVCPEGSAIVNFVGSATGVAPLSYEWNFGDGGTASGTLTPSHEYSAGTYSATLTVTDGCDNIVTSAAVEISFAELAAPTADAGGPYPVDDVCPEGSAIVNFVGSATGVAPLSYEWNFGDGGTASGTLTPSHEYSAGTYSATLTVTDGCDNIVTSAAVEISFAELAAPTADAGGPYPVDDVCPEGSAIVNFVGSATGVAPLSYEWNFGDGGTASGTLTPSHEYSAGTYSATLTVTDGCDNIVTSAAVEISFAELAAPTADAGGPYPVDDVCPEGSAIVNFVGSATGVAPLSYEWNFGDGGTASGTLTPSHEYSAGTYSATLTVTDGCDNIVTSAAVEISFAELAAPTADAGGPYPVDDVCPEGSAIVNFVGSATGVAPLSYEWNFGDGGTASGTLTPSHEYSAGTYSATLTVTDGCDNIVTSAAVEISFAELAAPTADAGGPYPVDDVCPEGSAIVNFVGSATGVAPLSYEWNFGDGGTASGTLTPSHEYSAGTYSATLTVTDGCDNIVTSAAVEISFAELPTLTGATFEGGPIVLCVDQVKDIGSEITITPYFDGVPGTTMTLDECVNTCADCYCTIMETDELGVPEDSPAFDIITQTTLEGLAEGIGYITVTYWYDNGLCVPEFEVSDPIQVVVEADEFFLVDNKGGIYGLSDECIEVVHNANHVFFGVSACIDPEEIIEFRYDRSHCGGGGFSEWIRTYGGVIDPTMINLCNGDFTYLEIRIGGEFGDILEFDIYRLGPGEPSGTGCP